MTAFPNSTYNSLVQATMQEIIKLSDLKGGEYAGDDDRLANFRRNANDLGLNMETVWRIYAGKHWDAITQFIKDRNAGKERVRLESLASRCDDLIVYLMLFKAMLIEIDGTIEQ